jgi:uncharacterized membrane protein YeaQ/YmgE (transglycosylase-associated protein family)
MGLISWIIVGIIAGWLAERLMGRDHGLLTNLVVGAIGSVMGGLIFSSVLGFHYREGLTLAAIVVATIGAVVFLYILERLRWHRRRPS